MKKKIMGIGLQRLSDISNAVNDPEDAEIYWGWKWNPTSLKQLG